jgi:hypothetical protein
MASISDRSKLPVGNFFEVTCLVRKLNGAKSVSDLQYLDLIPLYSKLGPRGGSLNQELPLAAAEQFLLDPEKVQPFSNSSA